MNEYKIRELADDMAVYFRDEAHADYTADGLFAALRWAWGNEEVALIWSIDDVIERAMDEFDSRPTISEARQILTRLLDADADYGALDYCIQQWKDKNR